MATYKICPPCWDDRNADLDKHACLVGSDEWTHVFGAHPTPDACYCPCNDAEKGVGDDK